METSFLVGTVRSILPEEACLSTQVGRDVGLNNQAALRSRLPMGVLLLQVRRMCTWGAVPLPVLQALQIFLCHLIITNLMIIRLICLRCQQSALHHMERIQILTPHKRLSHQADGISFLRPTRAFMMRL